MIKIVVNDDHQIVRGGVVALLNAEPDFEVIGQAGDGLDAVRIVEELKPDVLVTDIEIPGISGFEVTRRVRAHVPETKIVVLSMYDSETMVQSALRAGAMGYILKESSTEELNTAVRKVFGGQYYLSPSLSERAVRFYAQSNTDEEPSAYDRLTEREREVLHLLLQGHTNAQIAEKLVISRRTAESHRANMMHKLGANNQSELMRIAMQMDALRPLLNARRPRQAGDEPEG